MIRFIIREGNKQRYQGAFGVVPSVGQFWFNPDAEFTIELTDGVRDRNSSRKLERNMEYFFHGDLIKFKLNDKPNAKGMYDFRAELVPKSKQKDLTDSSNCGLIEEIPSRQADGNDSLGENTIIPTSKRSQKTKEVN